ncbi:MAG TPA: hypothetical protein VMW20_02890, partial [Candidatus Nanoarchaeia archaeon]|nr:hypothetical protein [Candidatus Nanoarchaeia archaeon]
MNKITTFALIICIVLTGLVISGCTDNNDNSNSSPPTTPISTPETFMELSIKEVLDNPSAYQNVQITGIVNQTIEVPKYTLMEISDGTGNMWVAGSSISIENGSQITASGFLRTEFYSDTLDKTFDVMLLAMSVSGDTATNDVNVSAIDGGTRIEEILNNTADLADREVKVAAVVTKNVVLIDYTMITIEDGTGELKAKSPNSFEYLVGEKIIVT